MSSTNNSWPPPSGLTTILVPRSSAVLQISSSTTISAPASLVFDILLHISAYKEWNNFIPSGTILKQPDTVKDEYKDRLHQNTLFQFNAVMDSSNPSKTFPTKLQVTDISTPDNPTEYIKDVAGDPSFSLQTEYESGKVYRVCWGTGPEVGFMGRVLRAERVQEIIVKSENECEVRNWEIMGGMAAYAVKWMYGGTLGEKFELWVGDLKRRAEGMYKERGATGA